jgi:hypothetical protein
MPPQARAVAHFPTFNFKEAAAREARNPRDEADEIEDIEEPQPPPPSGRHGVPIGPGGTSVTGKVTTNSTPSLGTGVSPGPAKSFKAEFLSSTSIPPDTMGAVGTTHIVSVTNDRMRIQTRDGVEVSRLTLTSFWTGVTIKGAAIAAFDPKVMFDRFNNRFILISSGNSQGVNSGAMFAVSATADPTGVWYRWAVAADATSTAAGGHWIDYPSMGFNKDWIVVNENVFNYGTAGSGFWGTQIYVLDKQAAYANTLGSINLFEAAFTPGCTGSATPELELACGFTMAPAIVEDNTTSTVYLVEDWDSTFAQLRLSKITGTAAAPLITVGTQFPQSPESWRFDAARISNKTTATTNGTTVTQSGGYMPQRQQSANLTSGTRVMANDSRVQNAVYRGGTLWCAHTVMLAAASQPAGQEIGRIVANPPDIRSGIQWWAIDPTIEGGASQPPLQRGRIFDPTADNCHNGLGGQNIIAGRCTSTATQVGEFFAFPNISVNQNNDVFIGFTRFSPLTYPNSAYVIRRSTDPVNTTRDVVVFRPGQANYNIGAGTSTAVHPTNPTRQNRWGDYSAAQTDPVNDTDFWTVQEYSGTVRDFGIGLAGNWETWWSMVRPSATQPVAGSAIISEFRLRGPQGIRDEFVEIYNPNATPVIVSTTDGSEGWALVYSNNGTAITAIAAIIPNGTVIPARGHFLIVDNPDAATGPTLVYSLNTAASTEARGAESDTGWSLDLADNGGLALFNTSTQANMVAGARLDSVGFSSIAAGLFKEGNGIPAITAATPTGQMTFYRNLSSGTPADTGANETDFVFVNPVVGETLGSTPTLGAAGPENLTSPINRSGPSTLPAAVLDSGVGVASPPNRVRSASVVANGAFGTLTFRRTFTNNTGAALSRLRFRIVDMTTAPAAGPNADLRALNSISEIVPVSVGGPVSVGATTLEVPPAQAAGGGLNGTLTVPTVTNATPLGAGSTTNLQFILGVQVTGAFNFCLVPEGEGATASAPVCFAGNSENGLPVITPAGPIPVIAGGASVVGATIATVSDVPDAAGSLVVTVIAAPVGISVTSIVNTGGTITATVSATCGAPSGDNNVTLQVIDSEGATSTGTLVVSVTPTPAPTVPTISGATSTCAGMPVTLTATSSGAVSYQWYLDGNPIGGETASTTSASTAGSYTVDATNACGTSSQSAPHVLTVNPTPPTPTISGTLTFCTGGNTTLTSSASSGNQWSLNGNPIGGATGQQYVVSTAGDYTVMVTLLGCPSLSSATSTVTETPIPNAPVITPGGPTTFCAGGGVSLSASASSGYQWYRDGNLIGATGQTYIATTTGTYTVTVSPAGCDSAQSAGVTVTVNPIPSMPTITPGGPTTFCAGSSVTLMSSSASGNQWLLNGSPIGGATNQAYVATASGSYTVTVTATGCTSPASAGTAVTVNPIPATPVIGTGGPTTFCAGGSVTLTSSSASGNQWSLNGSPIGGATAQQYIATASGNYTVIVTTSGCSSAASAATTVTVNPLPATPTITPGGPTTFCAGGNVTLTSSSATGNQWSLNGSPIGGATAQQYVASVAGDYSVIVTTGGCSSAASAVTTVTVNPNPVATITAPGSVVAGSTGHAASVANAGLGATYAWTIGNGTITAGVGTNAITFTAGAAGTLTLNVTVTTAAGCPASSGTTNVTVTAAPPAVTVTSITPSNGPAFGNTPITVNGTGFLAGATVTLGGTAATNVVVVNSTKITAKTAAHAVGAVNVVVTNTNTASGTLTNGFTYRGQQFDPNGDSMTDPADIFYLVNFLFTGGPAPAGAAGMLSGDANGDGVVDPSDIFYIVHFLFTNGPVPFSTPDRTVSTSASSLRGAVTLGQAQRRDGRWVVPVIVTMEPGSAMPDSLSLRVRFSGQVGDAAIRHVVPEQPVFEISRVSSDALAYLVAFDQHTPILRAGSRSVVVAELTVPAGAGRLEVDGALTMLISGGTHKATVAGGTLRVQGTTIVDSNDTPRPHVPNNAN